MTLKLDWCGYDAARYAVENWHYSRSLPTPPLVRIGAWENGRFIGVVIFSRGANNNLSRGFGLPQTSVSELSRIALDNHSVPVSRIIRIAMQLLRSLSPSLRLLVSYADPSRNHHGGIYQASGWVYLGQSAPTIEYLAPDKKQWHGRMVSASGRNRVYGQRRSVWRHDQCIPVSCPGKHKYAHALDNKMRQQITSLAKPYPKRAESIASDALALPGEIGRCKSDLGASSLVAAAP